MAGACDEAGNDAHVPEAAARVNPIDLLEPGRLLSGALFRDLMAVVDDLPAPGTRIGVFRIVRELARGGMGVVYLAERDDGQFRQQVALKWLSAREGAVSEALFRRERQTLAELRHPHIARLVDGGQREDGRPWLAMELIEGDNLDRHCVQRALPMRARLALFLEVCDAVAYAHGRGVLHRDIKPSNVMVDADGRVRLLDFGIAALAGEEQTAAVAFTPGYASPEQRRGEPATVVGDIYQLGRLLAALLARDDKEQRTVRGHDRTPGDAEALPAGLPHDLALVIRRAQATQPEDRYPTVPALAADLRAYLGSRPIVARRREPLHVFARWVSRHPWVAMASVLVFALSIAGISLSIQRITAERDRADERARVASTVLAFLEDDLLAAADPGAMPGHEMTVRQALDRAERQVGTRFAQAPVEQIALRTTLTRLYSALGVAERAESHARAALSLARTAAPEQMALLQLELADVLINRDQLDAAEQLLATATTAPALQRDTLRSRLAYQRGDYAGSAALLRPYFAESAAPAWASPAAATRLAQSLRMLGENAAALALVERAGGSVDPASTAADPEQLALAHDRGVLLRHLGRFDDATAALVDVLRLRREVLGDAHPETVMTINELATVYQEQRQFAQAEPLFREALAARERLYGESHHLTRNSMSNLGLLLSLSGQLADAAVLYERTLRIETALIGERHPDTIALMHNIAGLYRKQARYDDALAMHARVLATAREVLGADAWQCGLFEVGRAQTLQAMDRRDQADAAFAKAEAILVKSLGADHPRTLRVREMRAALNGLPAPASS